MASNRLDIKALGERMRKEFPVTARGQTPHSLLTATHQIGHEILPASLSSHGLAAKCEIDVSNPGRQTTLSTLANNATASIHSTLPTDAAQASSHTPASYVRLHCSVSMVSTS